MGKRFIVIGGAGFIGSHLVDGLLGAGAEKVIVVDNFFLGKRENLQDAQSKFANLIIYNEDAADYFALGGIIKKHQPDIIFNLATKALLYSFDNPHNAFKVNTDIALNLAELLRDGKYESLIHFSSSEVYGSAVQVPMTEEHPLLPETSYAAGKAAADLLFRSYVGMYDLDIAILRPFNNYGPRQNAGAYSALIPITMRRIESGEKPIIHGDGLQTRDFIYVGDTVRIALKILERDFSEIKGHAYNICSGIETSVKDVVKNIAAVSGYKGEIIYERTRKADVKRHLGFAGKIKKLLPDFTLTAFPQGIAETFNWYKNHE